MSDCDYNDNTSDEECDPGPDTWEDEEEEDEQEEKKEITYKVCLLIIFRFYHFDFLLLRVWPLVRQLI